MITFKCSENQTNEANEPKVDEKAAKNKEDVVDADFEEVKPEDDKKNAS